MARPLRLEFPGAVYYLASEGNGGEVVFHGEEDRVLFWDTLQQACQRFQWEVLAFRLVARRLEMVVHTPAPNLVAGMKWLLGAFTIKYNRRHQRRGHLLAGRYRSVLIEPKAPFLPAGVDYVHLAAGGGGSPALPEAEDPWCSLRYYLLAPAQRPPWLQVAPVFNALDLKDDDAGRAKFAARLRTVAAHPPTELWASLRRGWRMGSDAFRAALLQWLQESRGNSAEPGRVLAREQADLIVREELARLGWTEAELARRPKGDPEKVRIARRVRAETAASLRWVAARLQMGAWTSAANSLYRKDKPAPAPRPVSARPRPAARPAVPAPQEKAAASLPAVPPEDLPLHCL
ncbi:MAG: hypothetical protein N3J91_08525 [Verrucomicrobiae bacterium]|nr:hypothetical protein [Verrucomicrobiae bacterium]